MALPGKCKIKQINSVSKYCYRSWPRTGHNQNSIYRAGTEYM